MTKKRVVALVEEALQVKIDKRSLKHSRNARYCAMIIMQEEGYTHQEIASFFNRDRSTITEKLLKADVLLSSDKDFKKAYWACIAALNIMEEAAA